MANTSRSVLLRPCSLIGYRHEILTLHWLITAKFVVHSALCAIAQLRLHLAIRCIPHPTSLHSPSGINFTLMVMSFSLNQLLLGCQIYCIFMNGRPLKLNLNHYTPTPSSQGVNKAQTPLQYNHHYPNDNLELEFIYSLALVGKTFQELAKVDL